MGFIMFLWEKYSNDRKMKQIYKKRDKLMNMILDVNKTSEELKDVQADFTRLQHDENMLLNESYREHYNNIQELNKKRRRMRKHGSQ